MEASLLSEGQPSPPIVSLGIAQIRHLTAFHSAPSLTIHPSLPDTQDERNLIQAVDSGKFQTQIVGNSWQSLKNNTSYTYLETTFDISHYKENKTTGVMAKKEVAKKEIAKTDNITYTDVQSFSEKVSFWFDYILLPTYDTFVASTAI